VSDLVSQSISQPVSQSVSQSVNWSVNWRQDIVMDCLLLHHLPVTVQEITWGVVWGGANQHGKHVSMV